MRFWRRLYVAAAQPRGQGDARPLSWQNKRKAWTANLRKVDRGKEKEKEKGKNTTTSFQSDTMLTIDN
jgi:hypothetical protein